MDLIAAATRWKSTPATPQGQSKYKIDAALRYDYLQWCAMLLKDNSGYIVEGGQGSDGGYLLGVLNGIFYNAATTLKPTWANHFYLATITPANSEDITAFRTRQSLFNLYSRNGSHCYDTTVAAAQAKFSTDV